MNNVHNSIREIKQYFAFGKFVRASIILTRSRVYKIEHVTVKLNLKSIISCTAIYQFYILSLVCVHFILFARRIVLARVQSFSLQFIFFLQ